MPTLQEIRGFLPVPETPKSVGFAVDDSSQPRDNQRLRRAPQPHQIGFHTPHTKHLLRNARGHYRNGILLDNAYPGDDKCVEAAQASWEWAIQQNPDVFAAVSMKAFSRTTLQSIGDGGWCGRGTVKGEAKRIVPDHYHIHPPDSLTRLSARDAQEYTRERVRYLLTDYRFLYGDFNGVSTLFAIEPLFFVPPVHSIHLHNPNSAPIWRLLISPCPS